jgi:hypothetical protein
VSTLDQCQQYIFKKHPEFGKELSLAIAKEYESEAIKKAQDCTYKSYLEEESADIRGREDE